MCSCGNVRHSPGRVDTTATHMVAVTGPGEVDIEEYGWGDIPETDVHNCTFRPFPDWADISTVDMVVATIRDTADSTVTYAELGFLSRGKCKA